MMPLAMGSFPLQLESIMFSLFVFSAILLGAGLVEGEAAGGLNRHDLAKRAAGDDTVEVLDSVRAAIRKRHLRVKRHPWRGRHDADSSHVVDPIPSAPAVIQSTNWAPYTAPYVHTGRNTYQPNLPATNNYQPSQPYTGGPNTHPKTTLYRATIRRHFQTTQWSAWVPTLPWTGPTTEGPWMPVHTNPSRPPPPPSKSTEQPEVIEFTPSPNPQSASDAVTTRYIIIGSVSGGVLIIVVVFIFVAVALTRHRRQPVADVENEMKVMPPPVVSNTPLNSVKGKKGSKSSRQSKHSKRDKSSLKKGIDNPTISSNPDSF